MGLKIKSIKPLRSHEEQVLIIEIEQAISKYKLLSGKAVKSIRVVHELNDPMGEEYVTVRTIQS
jgi:hypothetical protein